MTLLKYVLILLLGYPLGTPLYRHFAVVQQDETSPAINPTLRFEQRDILKENSGMICWDGLLWQHNDGGGWPTIYATDTGRNDVVRKVTIGNARNVDWEDMTQDADHLFVGDFGNNEDGARKDLKIYRLSKSDIAERSGNIRLEAEIISFRYPDQPVAPQALSKNSTDHDCEAMIAFNGKLYLFTKQWSGGRTTLYALENRPGFQTARMIGSLDVKGMITGADISPDGNKVILTGYSFRPERFICLLEDFIGDDFFSGRCRKIPLRGLCQTESVAFKDDTHVFIGSESLPFSPSRLEMVDLTMLQDKQGMALTSSSTPQLASAGLPVRNTSGH
jgi:hypothetical protein